ncbi:MAG: WD40 repeat domain-containing protein [Planctomycetaceae bacterium]
MNPRLLFSVTLLFALFAPSSLLQGADEIEAHRSNDELIIRLPRLDVLRHTNPKLTAELRVRHANGPEKTLAIDLSDPAIQGTIVVDVSRFGSVASASVVVRNLDGKQITARQFATVPETPVRSQIPMSPNGSIADIQPGSAMTSHKSAPRIAMPDVVQLRTVRIPVAARTLKKDDITYPVIARGDSPLRCASFLVGRQTAAPNDPHAASLYVTYKKAIFVGEKLDRWFKFLVEVPIQKGWGEGQGDETFHLSSEVKIHVTNDVKEKDWSGRQRHILGEGDDDLGQTLSAVDDEGRIYFIAESRVVRFDPRRQRFECSPPLGLQKLCPGGDTMKGSPGWLTGNLLMLCTRGRIFLVDILDYKTPPNPPGVDVPQRRIGGLFSIPQDWSDAAAFVADTRLHVGTWETASPTLYKTPPVVGAATDERKLSMPMITEAGLLILPTGRKSAGGPWRLDLDENGNNVAFGEVTSLNDTVSTDGKTRFQPTREATIHGVPRTMVHLVGTSFGRHLVGPAGLDGFEIPRASIRQLLMADGWDASMLLPATSRHAYRTYAGAPQGTVTVKYDVTNLLKSLPAAQGPLADSLNDGPSLGPVFLVNPIPGVADNAVAVSDYSGYPLCQLDFSDLTLKRTVFKTPVPAKSAVATGLGAYDSLWVSHGDERWLLITGYTGMTRIRYSKADKVLDSMTSDAFHTRMAPMAVDGHVRGGLKHYDRIFPVFGGRMLDSGTGRPGRGGTPFTTGIEVFNVSDIENLGKIPSQTAAYLSRCCGALGTLQSRLVWNLHDGECRQEIFGSGQPSQVFVDDLDAKNKSLVPSNLNEKIFLYAFTEKQGLHDLFGFALPLSEHGRSVASHLALSPCHQYLVVLTDDGTLYTCSIAQKQFVDGLKLRNVSGDAVTTMSFRRPGERIITAPGGQLFILTAPSSSDPVAVQFDRIDVSHSGQLSVIPHIRIQGNSLADCEDLDNCVRCFMPDLKRNDGTVDLVIGWDSKDRALARPSVRVITDFVASE